MKSGADEFAIRLRALGVNPRRSGIWLMVGKPMHAAGWKLHISATVLGVDSLFDRALPCLVRHEVHFKMAAGRDAIVQLGAGTYGESQIGKVITVYPRNDSEAVVLARELIEHTRNVAGPRVPTDLHLGEAVYARYGSVRPRITHDRFGEPIEVMLDGTGKWVPDLRAVPFLCPQGIAIPFPTVGAARARPRPGKRDLLGGRYLVTDVLRAGIGGSVFRAIDVHDVGHPVACVLKQARPHYSADERGRDRRTRLEHEGLILERLRGLAGVAPSSGYFEQSENGYLPVVYIPGVTLNELVHRLLAGGSWMSARAQSRQRLLRCMAQLVRCLSAAHSRGVIHRDVAPGNVWVSTDDRVYLLDWECAYVEGSRQSPFRLGTPGFSDLSRARRTPVCQDDWHACARVLAFVLTGLDPAAFVHGRSAQLAVRLAALTGLRDSKMVEGLARSLASERLDDLNAATLMSALAALKRRRADRSRKVTPLFSTAAHDSVLAEALQRLSTELKLRVDRLQVSRITVDAAALDAHSGIAGLLYVLAAAHGARVAHLDSVLAERTASVLTARTSVTPDLPGLVHGSAGRALAVAAAVQAGCITADERRCALLADALAGRLDWPDFTHGAAGQGFASLACHRRLRSPQFLQSAVACAGYLIRTQRPDGAWALPEGGPNAGERYTGFAHGAAGMMAYLGAYAAVTGDVAADVARRRAEGWLISCARRGRGGRWQWPQSQSFFAPGHWWCHGSPGIALGWLCVARAQGPPAVAQEYLIRALEASSQQLRSDSFNQCHGMAGVGEVYLDADFLLSDDRWSGRAVDIAQVLVSLFRRRRRQPWHYLTDEPATSADGLMLGTAGIVHFLLRQRHPAAVTSPPLLR